jgi:Lon protease-like protein
MIPAAYELPLFPLNTVLFPGGPLALRIFEPRYLDMVTRCLKDGGDFGVVLIREGAETGPADFHGLGTRAHIVDFDQLPEGLLGLSTLGNERFRVLRKWTQADGLHLGEVESLGAEPTVPLPAEYAHLSPLIQELLPKLEAYAHVENCATDASWVSYRLAELLPLTMESRQALLELGDPIERLRLLDGLIKQQEA